MPIDYTTPYDVREVAARIVDGSDFEEFKPRYGPGTVCMQASIMGHAVGLIGNNGPFDPEAAAKATHFFQLCDQSQLPIIFLNNTTGYIVGTESEHKGMIKLGSKMIQAVSNVRVPKLALYIGASFGVIDPRDSRKVLGFALETIFEAQNRTLHPNAFGVARI